MRQLKQFSENDLRNGIWHANDGRVALPGYCASIEEMRNELLRRGLSGLGFHEESSDAYQQGRKDALEGRAERRAAGRNKDFVYGEGYRIGTEINDAIECLETRLASLVSINGLPPDVWGAIEQMIARVSLAEHRTS